MTLGQRISLYRKKLNISQEELGARLGVSRQAVSKWETDLSAPDLNNLGWPGNWAFPWRS